MRARQCTTRHILPCLDISGQARPSVGHVGDMGSGRAAGHSRCCVLQDDIDGVAAVPRDDDALARVLTARPDLALQDIEIPALDELCVASEFHQRLPACRILMLTTFGCPGYVRRAMESGAVGFLLTDARPTSWHTQSVVPSPENAS
jgi:CheY-like chemotaxis protein